MIKLIIFIILTSLAVCIGPLLSDNQGLVHIVTNSFVIETSITTAITLYLLSIITLFIVFFVVKRFINLPKGTLKAFKKRAFNRKLSIQDQAFIDYSQGQYDKALGLLKHATNIKNMSVKSLIVAAQSAFSIGLYDYTRTALDEASSRGKKEKLAAAIVRAKLNYDIGNAAVALEYLNGCSGITKNKFVCKLYLDCYVALKKFDKIVEMKKDLIKFDVITEEQSYVYFYHYIETALRKAANVNEIETLLKTIKKSEKQNGKIMGAFIYKLLKLGEVNKARELTLDQLKDAQTPEFLETISHWEIAIPDVLIFLKKYASKNIITTQVNLPLLKAMANLEYKSGLMRDALEDYKQALSIEPSYDIYLRVGTILTGMQKFTEATEFYTKATSALSEHSVLTVSK